MKGAFRGKQKCLVKYGGDCSHMSDRLRATVQVDGTIDDLYKCLHIVISKFSSRACHVCHFADRYQHPLGNYCDLLTLVRVDGFVCELQFNLLSILTIKESPAGHGNYEKERLANDDLLASAIAGNLEGVQGAIQRGAIPNVKDIMDVVDKRSSGYTFLIGHN